jgi:hypothetical protein
MLAPNAPFPALWLRPCRPKVAADVARAFHPSLNLLARTAPPLLLLMIVAAGWAAWSVQNSSYVTGQSLPVDQQVPFSHEHHVSGLGIDCRYCHTSVTGSGFAGVPPTNTCMSCHSQIWTNAPMLDPVRASWRDGQPLRWRRVNVLPGYVYFDHEIHVNKGVGCSSCHGRVDQMPLTWPAASLQMQWCLECHRAPEKHLRPRDAVFEMDYRVPADQERLGRELAERYHVRPAGALTDCYTCHR